jgi:hypothetical protein
MRNVTEMIFHLIGRILEPLIGYGIAIAYLLCKKIYPPLAEDIATWATSPDDHLK